MNGKGDKPRPTDLKKFRKNFEKAFSKKKNNKKVRDSIDVNIDQDTGAIQLKSSSGVEHTEKKINIIKEYTDNNGIKMVIVNINDSMTNKVMTSRQLKTLQHELVNEEPIVINNNDETKKE